MDSTLWAALIALCGVVVGAALTEILARRREDAVERRLLARDGAERIRQRRLARILATRRVLTGNLDSMTAIATGDLDGSRTAGAKVAEGEDLGDIRLLGDLDLVREYQDVSVLLRDRFGRTLTVEDQTRVLRLQSRITRVLDDQDERAERGETLLRVEGDSNPELFDTEHLVNRMRLPIRRPSLPARLARWWMERQVPR